METFIFTCLLIGIINRFLEKFGVKIIGLLCGKEKAEILSEIRNKEHEEYIFNIKQRQEQGVNEKKDMVYLINELILIKEKSNSFIFELIDFIMFCFPVTNIIVLAFNLYDIIDDAIFINNLKE